MIRAAALARSNQHAPSGCSASVWTSLGRRRTGFEARPREQRRQTRDSRVSATSVRRGVLTRHGRQAALTAVVGAVQTSLHESASQTSPTLEISGSPAKPLQLNMDLYSIIYLMRFMDIQCGAACGASFDAPLDRVALHKPDPASIVSADEPIDLIPTSGSRWSHRARSATAEHELGSEMLEATAAAVLGAGSARQRHPVRNVGRPVSAGSRSDVTTLRLDDRLRKESGLTPP